MKIIKCLIFTSLLCGIITCFSLGSLAVEHTHNFISSVVDNATCKEGGKLLFSCTCGESYYEDTKPLGHSLSSKKCSRCNKFVIDVGEELTLTATTPQWSLDWGWQTNSSILRYDTWSIDVSNNCYYTAYFTGVTEGETSVYFIYNNYYYSSCIVSVEHRTHKFDEYVSNDDATCTDGTMTAKCLYCDAVDTVIEPNSAKHSFSNYISDNNATCIADGTKSRRCQLCGFNETVDDTSSKLGHDFKLINKVEASCESTGLVNYKCSRCVEVKSETIPATNHANATADNGTSATCTQTGFTAGKYCPDCDTWLEGHKTIPVTAHSYTSTITQEPTCWKEGVTTYTCTCGDSYTETIEKKEHEYRPWETKVKPKCTQPGMEWSYCLICDSDFEREIPATGHTVIEYVMRATTDEQAAYGGDGAYMTACDVCNEVFKQEFFARPAEYILSTTKCTYNGKARKPSVTVKDADGKTLIEGQDYDLIYPDEMKLPGKYNIEVLFKGNYLGGKDLTFTIAPKVTTGVKAKTQTTSSITLTWTKTTGATGYRVYQYSPSKGEYVLKKSVKGTTTYKVTGLKAGTTYKFKIKPYVKTDDGTVIWGSASSALSTATKPSTPTVKSVTASSGKATLSWNNISGESGYQVYYSTSKNGTYKKMKSVSADTVKYTTSKLTAGKTYYFKVRAYKKVDGKTIFGSFSDIKYIKVPAVYYITKTGEKYHVDGCRSLSRSKIQISYSNAVARGYEPCDACILK